EPRSYRAEGVVRLGEHRVSRLTLTPRHVARRDVVDDGIAGDDAVRLFLAHVAAFPADDDRQLGLAVELRDTGGLDDVAPGTVQRRRGFQETGGHRARLPAGVPRVFAVVAPHRDQLGRIDRHVEPGLGRGNEQVLAVQ